MEERDGGLDWLLDRLLKMHGELIDARNTATDFEEALAHAIEDYEMRLGAGQAKPLEKREISTS